MPLVTNNNIRTELAEGVLVAHVECGKITDFEKEGLLSDIHAGTKDFGWRLVLNLAQVELVGSSGLGLFVSLRKEAEAHKGRLVICNISPEIMGSLKVTKLDKLFRFAGSVEEAVKAAKG